MMIGLCLCLCAIYIDLYSFFMISCCLQKRESSCSQSCQRTPPSAMDPAACGPTILLHRAFLPLLPSADIFHFFPLGSKANIDNFICRLSDLLTTSSESDDLVLAAGGRLHTVVLSGQPLIQVAIRASPVPIPTLLAHCCLLLRRALTAPVGTCVL
jgi:hypothetical protein